MSFYQKSSKTIGKHSTLVYLNPDLRLFSDLSLLIPLPPDFPPFWDRINKLLAPTHQALGILHESLTSGEHLQFAQRVWEKAQTDEPFVLAQRTFSRVYEQWKKRDVADEDDPKKGST